MSLKHETTCLLSYYNAVKEQALFSLIAPVFPCSVRIGVLSLTSDPETMNDAHFPANPGWVAQSHSFIWHNWEGTERAKG